MLKHLCFRLILAILCLASSSDSIYAVTRGQETIKKSETNLRQNSDAQLKKSDSNNRGNTKDSENPEAPKPGPVFDPGPPPKPVPSNMKEFENFKMLNTDGPL